MNYIKLSSSDDEQAWLEARREGVTATDAARLATGGAAEWVKLKAEKRGHHDFGDNQFFAWGRERETVIADQVKHIGEHNTNLLQSTEDPRWLATPDLIAPETNTVADIKTAVWRGQMWEEPPSRYLSQLQWQIFVAQADHAVLVVEYHEDFRVKFLDPHILYVPRDDEHIAHLVSLAERFLGMGEPSEDDVILARAIELKQKAKEVATEWSEFEQEVFSLKGTDAPFNHVHPDLGSLSYSKPKPRAQFLKEKFEESHPDLAGQFTVEGKVPKPSIRVTPLKEKK